MAVTGTSSPWGGEAGQLPSPPPRGYEVGGAVVGQAARFDGRLGLRAHAGWVAPAGGCRPGWVASAKFDG